MGGRKQMSARQLKPRDVGDFAAGPVNVETWRLGNHMDLSEGRYQRQ